MVFEKKRVSKDYIEKTYTLISQLHDKIISHSGGTKGIRDAGGLYHSIHKILMYQDEYPNDFISVGAFVYEELARRHHFHDGNKRTAHAFAKIMLFLMGYHLKIEYKEAVHFIIEVAKYNSSVPLTKIKEWVKKNLVVVPERYKKNTVKYLNDAILDVGYDTTNN